MNDFDVKVLDNFPGKVVRKDTYPGHGRTQLAVTSIDDRLICIDRLGLCPRVRNLSLYKKHSFGLRQFVPSKRKEYR